MMGGEGEEENGGSVRIRSVRVLQRDSARFRLALLSSPLLCSPPRHSTSRRNDAIALLRTLPLPATN